MQRGTRIILYGNDSWPRSQALVAALTEGDPTASVLILTGTPLSEGFTLPERVDHIRLPGVIQRPDGTCVSEALGLDIDEITTLRANLIQSAVAAFEPDLLVVNSIPAGFRGELLPTLEALAGQRRARIVLGLGDVLGDQKVLAGEWGGKRPLETTERYYDEIWVHGSHCLHDPTKTIGRHLPGPWREALWRG